MPSTGVVNWFECLWIRPEGFDWIWSLPSPCTCSSSHEDFPFFQPRPFWKSDHIINGHIVSFPCLRIKRSLTNHQLGAKDELNVFFGKIIKEDEDETRIFGTKTMLCRTHQNASPPLATRSNWLGGFVSVTKLFSLLLLVLSSHFPSFISTIPSWLHDQYWTMSAKLFCSSAKLFCASPFVFPCTAVCFFSGTDALTRLFARALECLRQSLACGEES